MKVYTPTLPTGMNSLVAFIPGSKRGGLVWIDGQIGLPIPLALTTHDLLVAFRESGYHELEFDE